MQAKLNNIIAEVEQQGYRLREIKITYEKLIKEKQNQKAKQYYASHREQMNAAAMRYYHRNRSKVLQSCKDRYASKKNDPEFIDKRRQTRAEFRANNPDYKRRCSCSCGGTYQKGNKQKHKRSERHLMYSRQTETINKLTKEVQRLRSELTEANARLGDRTDSITIGFDD